MTGAPEQFTLSLLGPFRLIAPGGDRIEVASRKGKALIAMLAMANEGERARRWLQEKLWGSRQQAQAASSLRRELSDLRGLLNLGAGPLLITGNDRARLDLARVQVDTHAAGPDEIASHEFLEGLDIPGEDGFEEWLREQRSALRARPRLAEARRAAAEDARGVAAAVPASRADARPRDGRARDGRGRPAVAVLAFGHPSSANEEVHLAQGLVEAVIAGLTRSKLLTVSSRQSLTFDGRGLSAERICADLGVDYIAQGQVRLVAGTARVSAHLTHGRDDTTVWSGRYDRPVSDLLAVEDDISGAVVSSLEPALLAHEEAKALLVPLEDLDHWGLFVRGRRHFWRSTVPDSRQATDLLVQALRLKPDDTPTLSLLAHCWLVEVWGGSSPDPGAAIAEAHRYALRAVHLDGSDAFAHFTLGVVLSTMGQPAQDMAEQRRALELNPSLAAAHGELGRLLAFAGQADEALIACDRAIGDSPNDPHLWLWLLSKAIACFTAKRYEEAARHAAAACATRPDYFFLHFLQAACAAAAGRTEEARIPMAEGLRLRPRYSLAALKLGHPFVNPVDLARYVEALKAAGWIDWSAAEDTPPMTRAKASPLS
jgi:TolB-like protein/predicted Zn-dependent protease